LIGSGPAVTTKGSASRGGRNAHEGSTNSKLLKSASVEQQKGSPYSKKSSSNRPPLKKSEKLTENGRPGAGCSKVNGNAKGNKPDVIELSSEDQEEDEDEEGSVADSVASGYNESQDESEEMEESEEEDEQQKRTPARRKKMVADSADLSTAGKKVAKKTPEKGRSASAKTDSNSKPSSKTSKVCVCVCVLCACIYMHTL